MSDDKEFLKKLEAKLNAVPDLPAEPKKSTKEKLIRFSAELDAFQILREELGSKPKGVDFERLRFEMARSRLERELAQLKQEIG